jgi:hypothetical protein
LGASWTSTKTPFTPAATAARASGSMNLNSKVGSLVSGHGSSRALEFLSFW